MLIKKLSLENDTSPSLVVVTELCCSCDVWTDAGLCVVEGPEGSTSQFYCLLSSGWNSISLNFGQSTAAVRLQWAALMFECSKYLFCYLHAEFIAF